MSCLARKELRLSTLGKIFSRQHIEISLLFFQKTGFDISCKLSPMENLHEKCWIKSVTHEHD